MKVLITGGAGFIGSHLSKKLFEDEYTYKELEEQGTDQKVYRRTGKRPV